MIPVKSIMPFQGNKQNTNLKKNEKIGFELYSKWSRYL